MVDTLTKAQIAENISLSTGLSKAYIEDLITNLLDNIIEIVEQDGKLVIPQFGTFSLQTKKARIGRNPKTMQEFTIPARTKIVFSPSPILKDFVNE